MASEKDLPVKSNKTDRQVQNNLFGKGIVKIVSSMIKMSNFLAKNVVMTNSLMLSRSEIGSHEVGKKIHRQRLCYYTIKQCT